MRQKKKKDDRPRCWREKLYKMCIMQPSPCLCPKRLARPEGAFFPELGFHSPHSLTMVVQRIRVREVVSWRSCAVSTVERSSW